MNKNIYISEFGLVNALGTDKRSILKNLLKGSQSGMTLVDDLLVDNSITVANISEKLDEIHDKPTYLKSRNNQLAMFAIKQIRDEVEELKAKYGAHRIAVVLGTSTSGISEGEKAMSDRLNNNEFPTSYDYRQQEIFNLTEFVVTELKLSGISLTISTACSSSAKAFKTAKELMLHDMADAAIVGGVDSLCGMTINGFHSLNSTSDGICNPSSINRDGINIGEAAAFAVLRQDKGEISLLGVGESSDAHHMSAPHPEGEGAICAMRSALEEANLDADDIDYINLHGTATPKNDEMEAKAISTVFGLETPCSSSKAMIGHTLGAAGATEVGLCWLLLNKENQYYAPHVWDNEKDPAIPAINLVGIGSHQNTKLSRCLSNSFAFGGNNVSVLIGYPKLTA